MQQAAESPSTHLMALRRFGNNIGIFWRVVVYALVIVSVLSVWADHPRFYATPRGWLALALAGCYLFAFTYGSRWIAGDSPDTYWKLRLNSGRVLYPWRAVALWAVLVALAVAMIALDGNFIWLLWIPYGMSFTLITMPRTLLLIVPTALLMMAYNHEFPASFTAPELLKFAGFAIGFACYSVVVYLPIVLLRHRFQRERMFLRLEQSHHELEEAHQQLERAAAQERELAVLRERNRLARDLHDTLGHSLALMTVKLEAAQRLRTVDPARADHEVAATQAIARSALADLRAAIADLRTPGGSRDCVGDALRRVGEEYAARAGWRLTCEIAPDVEPLDDSMKETLLRTSLEALANIERHANAQTVCVRLTMENGSVILCIEDDGVGILTTNPPHPVEAASRSAKSTRRDSAAITSPPGHYGITGMRERTTGAGGAFSIGAGEGDQGTRVEVRLPIGVARTHEGKSL